MGRGIYSLIALVIAIMFWFSDASIHYFIYDEPEFEFVPGEFNELWMRIVIVVLIILFGIFGDYFSRRMVATQKQLEGARIYSSMLFATHHILNNLLNQMQLFKIEAQKSKDFDRDIIKLYDIAFDEALGLVKRLSQIEHISDERIRASVHPDTSSDKTNPADANNSAADWRA